VGGCQCVCVTLCPSPSPGPATRRREEEEEEEIFFFFKNYHAKHYNVSDSYRGFPGETEGVPCDYPSSPRPVLSYRLDPFPRVYPLLR
jgi:hypothetical protein